MCYINNYVFREKESPNCYFLNIKKNHKSSNLSL